MAQTRRDFLKTLGLAAAAVSFGSALPSDAGGPMPMPQALDEILHVGDTFTIAGRYAIDPITRKATDVLQKFIVTSVTTDRAELGFHPTLKTETGPSWPKVGPLEQFNPPPLLTRKLR